MPRDTLPYLVSESDCSLRLKKLPLGLSLAELALKALASVGIPMTQ